jgi:hypothetical protein
MTGPGLPAGGQREEDGMQSSTYDLNGWGPPTEALPCAEHEEFHARMARLGFHRWFTVPGEDRDAILLSLDVWGGGPPPWQIMVCVEQAGIETYDEILVASPAALWRLPGEFVPVIARLSAVDATMQRDVLLRRAYRVWHGHDAAEVSRACDPLEARHRADARHDRDLRRREVWTQGLDGTIGRCSSVGTGSAAPSTNESVYGWDH